ncbi:hypothetical protein Ga0609869_003457 [Rhodovulum iodosum]|uniref:CTP synthetase n=1 Tax=Rhodovulum iodosum TaxID=68291 RepID=A0ABV3XY54_9RHOB|nr:hypothetical protein [Rhodovulum robiginosum]RSK38069.1 hypothetical protein EJA01_02845 [Rhodovulum robiginosum]
MPNRLIPLVAALALMPAAAHAYIGPGMGLGVIASVLGVVAAFFMALIGLLWFPLKRLVKRRRAPAAPETSD